MRIETFCVSGLCCVVSLTCDDLSNLILMFLCMRIVMGFSCVDWDVVASHSSEASEIVAITDVSGRIRKITL
jgi:hypothetical protein